MTHELYIFMIYWTITINLITTFIPIICLSYLTTLFQNHAKSLNVSCKQLLCIVMNRFIDTYDTYLFVYLISLSIIANTHVVYMIPVLFNIMQTSVFINNYFSLTWFFNKHNVTLIQDSNPIHTNNMSHDF